MVWFDPTNVVVVGVKVPPIVIPAASVTPSVVTELPAGVVRFPTIVSVPLPDIGAATVTSKLPLICVFEVKTAPAALTNCRFWNRVLDAPGKAMLTNCDDVPLNTVRNVPDAAKLV